MYNNNNNNNESNASGLATVWTEDHQKKPEKLTHPEWGVMKEQDFHPLTLKHQRDLEILHQSGNSIVDFYFWQANLGGYCMANMIQSKVSNVVVSSDGAFVLVRRIVEGAPHPGRKKKAKKA
ncbi:hypothetical protein BDF21DRAFT_347647 [Thamnidium elegans]|nr:hypothetical protein BDF21DRAFT_347647 [Thamnidium elegans]